VRATRRTRALQHTRSEAGGVHTRAENKTNHWTRRLRMKSVVKKTPSNIPIGLHQHQNSQKNKNELVPRRN
jgi:hypothetical protein